MHFVIIKVKNYLRKVMKKFWGRLLAAVPVAILRDATALRAEALQDEDGVCGSAASDAVKRRHARHFKGFPLSWASS
jgi:hypothetical protein